MNHLCWLMTHYGGLLWSCWESDSPFWRGSRNVRCVSHQALCQWVEPLECYLMKLHIRDGSATKEDKYQIVSYLDQSDNFVFPASKEGKQMRSFQLSWFLKYPCWYIEVCRMLQEPKAWDSINGSQRDFSTTSLAALNQCDNRGYASTIMLNPSDIMRSKTVIFCPA